MSSQSNLLNKELFNCEKCGMKYSLNTEYKWCDFCKILKNFTNWTSGNEIIDDFIREKHLKFDKYDDIVFEWIPYDQFKNIKEINKDGEITLYSAMWENGPLYFDHNDGWIRNSEKVDLKCFNNSQNSQNITHEFVNEIKQYSTKYDIIIGSAIYGISQKPDTKDYIMVLYHDHCEECGKKYTNSYKKWCMSCQINNLKNRTSGNKIIDDFIQEKQLKFDSYEIFFEWIPYNQFKNIKEIGKDGETLLYVAIWKNGPLHFDEDNNKKEWTRKSDEIVDLK
ncbi:hypothetical protein C1645_816287, partial [Glomus cerebriforme]